VFPCSPKGTKPFTGASLDASNEGRASLAGVRSRVLNHINICRRHTPRQPPPDCALRRRVGRSCLSPASCPRRTSANLTLGARPPLIPLSPRPLSPRPLSPRRRPGPMLRSLGTLPSSCEVSPHDYWSVPRSDGPRLKPVLGPPTGRTRGPRWPADQGRQTVTPPFAPILAHQPRQPLDFRLGRPGLAGARLGAE